MIRRFDASHEDRPSLCGVMLCMGSYCGAAKQEGTPELSPNAAKRFAQRTPAFDTSKQHEKRSRRFTIRVQIIHLHAATPLFPLLVFVVLFCGCLRAVNTPEWHRPALRLTDNNF